MFKMTFIAFILLLEGSNGIELKLQPAAAGEVPVVVQAQRLVTSKPSPPSKPRKSTPKPKRSPLRAWIDSLFQRLRKEPPRGSRGPLCPISPGLVGPTPTIWSDRPLFVWRGEANQIVVRDWTTDSVMWQRPVTPEIQQVTYSGSPLQPGQAYVWEVANTDQVRRSVIFAVMSSPDRDQLMAHMLALEPPVQAPEAAALAALQQADYLGERRLWSDVLQVLHGLEDPAPEVIQTVEAMSTYICDGPDALVSSDELNPD